MQLQGASQRARPWHQRVTKARIPHCENFARRGKNLPGGQCAAGRAGKTSYIDVPRCCCSSLRGYASRNAAAFVIGQGP
jgi:hypothetical protein